MNSLIYRGRVMHARKEPVPHNFDYPVYFYAFDIDELANLDRQVSLFGYNRVRPVAIHDADYLNEGPNSIRDKLLVYIRQEGFEHRIGRITLITAARYFHYVFNPVSFYYCYNLADELEHVIAEVNNTYQERHLYMLREGSEPRPGFRKRYTVPKAIHVSPFNDMKGDYDFHFSDIGDKLDIRLDILRDGRVAFRSRLRGDAVPFTTRNLGVTLLRYPLTASLTMPRILWQAAKLRWLRKLRHRPKPAPSSHLTIRVAPRPYERWAMKQIFKTFDGFTRGSLTVVLPNGAKHRFGDDQTGVRATLKVNSFRMFWRIVFGGDNAFGDSYVNNDWESQDPVAVLRVFADNFDIIEKRSQVLSIFKRIPERIGHELRKNTRRGSRKNIFEHYDLGNEFFRLFLDPTMTYSCALFQTPTDDLQDAQRNKLRGLIDKAHITADDHVVEIGCGWGSFAIEAARRTGCRVTAITISEAQKTVAEERIRRAQLDDRINVKLCDYRDLEGQFDKLISIEMLEAVGHEYYGRFFEVCDRLLKPDGVAVIQVITMSDQQYARYRHKCDWIQKRVFPGATVPALGALVNALTMHSKLVVENVTNIGAHYARTLAEWREQLSERAREVEAMGFDNRFMRTWEYYFSYCEAGFASGLLGDLQIVLKRPEGRRLELQSAAGAPPVGLTESTDGR
jgi:cyclopropane-fatty-acyl-phospholipid synthase